MTDESATKFNYSEAPRGDRGDGNESLRDFYRRLWTWNTGRDIGGWVHRSRATHEDHRAVFETVADFLEVTDYQEMRAWEIFSDLPSATHQGNPTQLLAVSTLALVCTKDGRGWRPDGQIVTRCPLFESLVDDLDYPAERVKSVFHRVEQLVGDEI